jgi:hypothetical protein
MTITEQDISQFAGSTEAEKTARELVNQGEFLVLGQSEDETLIWGNCAGSGSEPYLCSVDFLDKEKWAGRCNCPSRQRPCKHTIGLLCAVHEGLGFPVGTVPDAIREARAKDKAKAEKAAKPALVTKAKAASEAKKCSAQLDGIALAEKILHNISLTGLSAITDKTKSSFEAQIKELGNYYIPGVQANFTELVATIVSEHKDDGFASAIEKITFIHALLEKGKTYLACKKADFEAFPAMTESAKNDMLNSPIEELLGYGWKLTELRDKGRMQTDAELLQLAFWVRDDEARKQWVDTGLWLSLTDKNLYITEDFRPYKRAKQQPPMDSFHHILTSSEFYVYPGDKNPRVRWEKQSWREVRPDDYQRAQSAGATDFTSVVKEVKNQIKSPLADKTPSYALHIDNMSVDAERTLFIHDIAGKRLMLRLKNYGERIRYLSREQVEGQTLVVHFEQDMETDELFAVPLAMITTSAVLRFI